MTQHATADDHKAAQIEYNLPYTCRVICDIGLLIEVIILVVLQKDFGTSILCQTYNHPQEIGTPRQLNGSVA